MSNEQQNPFAPPTSTRRPLEGPASGTGEVPIPAPVPPPVPAPAPVAPTDAHPGRAAPAPDHGFHSPSPQPVPLVPAPVVTAGTTPYAPVAPVAPSAAPPLSGFGSDSWGRPLPPDPTPREGRRRGVSPLWVVPLLIGALLMGAVGGVLAERVTDSARPVDAALPVGRSDGAGLSGELTGVAAVAAQVLESVVSIEVRGAQGAATGSGFVLREDGYILTNNHVVSEGATGGAQISVLFADGTESTAELIGRTSEYDLAVIRVDRSGLTPLVLGDSDAVSVGDPVIAVGAPLGLTGTVTTGIVSALNRPVSAGNASETAFINAIQTDAAINPGNSGGPLVNGIGEVVGINSAIAQPPGQVAASGSIGLGFAIPSNQARRTAEELIESGTATYPVIGVLLDSRYSGQGVQVATEAQNGNDPVTAQGPADRAGIRPGDIILAIDGRPVTQADELIVAIRAKTPGDSAVLTVRTDGAEREVRVVLDEVSTN
ncbi:trypsin-like peptidase domain-containing protein [Actinotalea sp. K2]|nr:trypsin-like peptidase domain-containing protein [Actinotalea sp. K2]MCL3862608.1 trypsin-like peptidase domain-containing protein [Actinotalea sp. K2]